VLVCLSPCDRIESEHEQHVPDYTYDPPHPLSE
jgi:hypothetical protein